MFLIFHYTNVESDLGLCGFLSFLTATACAQTVNFFVQKNFVFKSNAAFSQAVPKYICLAALRQILIQTIYFKTVTISHFLQYLV